MIVNFFPFFKQMSIEKESFLKDIRQEELHVVDFMKVSQRRFSYAKLFICQTKVCWSKIRPGSEEVHGSRNAQHNNTRGEHTLMKKKKKKYQKLL